MHSKILIIEGTSGVGKSFLADALLRNYITENKKIRSLLYLRQAHIYGPLAVDEDRCSLTNEMNKRHLDQIYNVLQCLALSLESEAKVKLYCLIDTLHLTHCFRPGIIEWGDVSEYDTKLMQIECKLIFIKAKLATIWARGIVPRLNEQFMLDYAKKYGNTTEAILQYFIKEQQDLEKLVTKCKLEKIYLDAEDDFELNMRKAYHFWIK
jgi:ABC-type dipeptide/oligopeptide/nickel transport system ATPase component